MAIAATSALSETSTAVNGGRWSTAADAAILALVVFAAVYLPDREDGSGAFIGSVGAFAAAFVGVAALRRSRVLPRRSPLALARYAALTVLLGAASGTANLLINYGLTRLDPRIHDAMVRKVTTYSDWSMIVTAPVVEELTFRLVLLSGVAWLLGRFMKKRERIFPVALVVSATLFSFIHPAYPIPFGDPIMLLQTLVVLLKSGAAGLLLGWIFWRWGLPYSMACHSAANGVHILLTPLFF